MSDLTTRNARAVMLTLQSFQTRMDEQAEKIVMMQRAIAALSADNQALRALLAQSLVARGTGPTVRG